MPMLHLNPRLSSLLTFTKRAGGNKLKPSTADEAQVVTQLQLKVHVWLLVEILKAGMVDLNFFATDNYALILQPPCLLLPPTPKS